VTDTQGMFGQYVRNYTLNVREIYLGYPLYVVPGESLVKSLRTNATDFISARGYTLRSTLLSKLIYNLDMTEIFWEVATVPCYFQIGVHLTFS
jgi:hypothetical protein